MKITKLRIRNLFGLKEFESAGKDTELTGANGVGKSAVIDAIKYALTNRSERQFIITKGESEGEVLIETDSGLRVHRKARTDKADYKSIKQGQEKDEKTEGFLREIFTELQLNPVEFASMDSKEQNRIILDLIDFKWDITWIKEQFGEIPPDVNYDQNILCVLHDIQSDEGYYFKTRQDVNRDARNKLAFVEEIGTSLPEGFSADKWSSVNLGELYKKIETIRNKNEWIEKAKTAVNGRENKIRSYQATYEIQKATIERETSTTRSSLEKQIISLENQIKSAKVELAHLEEKKIAAIAGAKATFETVVAKLDGEVKQYEDIAKEDPQSYADLQAEAEHAEKMKSFVNEFIRMVSLQEEVKKLNDKSQKLTEKIEKARALPGEILANANIPIVGLEIKNGIPLINGLPISNLSDGEKMALCISVAVQREGSLKMLLIDGVERLASVKREEVFNLLKSRGVQFVCSRTTDEDLLTVTEL